MPANDSTKRKPNAGSFKPGPDSRRHVFTAAECSRGFWTAIAVYAEKGGDPRNFLRRKMSARGQAFNAAPKRDRGRLAKAA